MYGGSFDSQSNRADWEGSIYLYDGDVGADEYIDLTGCTVTLSLRNERDGLELSATTDDATITFPDNGYISWVFTASQMASLCPGTYKVGIRISRDDKTMQLLIGTLPIVEGVDQ